MSSEIRCPVLADLPVALQDVLRRLARGDLPANVALMHLIMHADEPEEVSGAIRASFAMCAASPSARSRTNALSKIWTQTPDAWTTVKDIVSVLPSGPRTAGPIEYWTRFFDLAAARAADSAAALYALGRADLLDAASREVMRRLREWNVLGRASNILEIGCGTGRFVAPLAMAGHLAIGIDTSGGMLRLAKLRCRSLQSALLVQTGGDGLSMFADSSFDAVLAIDSYPYIVAAGRELAEAHMREAARVLRSQGSFVILNYSYRDDPAIDAQEIARLAAECGLSIIRNGTRDFALWDARAYVMRKPRTSRSPG
jgi:ubiquinone/menaquinone biosynthesis C-methylase UbiE